MTLQDWVHESIERYRTQSAGTATAESLQALRLGGQRYVGPYVGSAIWQRGDWDVVVVLDACRVDQMAAVIDEYDQLPDEVNSVWSNASCSIDWVDRTFNDHPKRAAQAGYVTANPFANHSTDTARSADLSDEKLARFKPLYKTHWSDITPESVATELHDEIGRAKVGSGIATVPPGPVTDHGIDAWRRRREYGLDQLVMHYMQPHEPYRSHPEWGSGDSKLLENLVDEDAEAGSSVWPEAKAGNVSHEALWEAGVDNLRWVLDDITERLLPNIDGTVVLTADHGNAMGEWGEWHHPPGALSPGVRKVPWVEIECADEETVSPELENRTDATDAEEKLSALGYL